MSISCLDYRYDKTEHMRYFYEWNGNIVIFGKPGALMMSLPPTITSPKGKRLMYQSVGTFNQSYIFEGSDMIHLLPVSNDTNHCAAIMSKMLISPDPQDNMAKHDFNLVSHLFINNVESSSPVLTFEKLSDDILQRLAQVTIDLYFKMDKDNYVKRTYTVKFEYYKAGNWRLLWIALACILLIFIAVLTLCIAKSLKAFKKRHNYNLIEIDPNDKDMNYSAEPILTENARKRFVSTKSEFDD